MHLSNNVIDVNDVVNFDYHNATKVIKFNHSYSLAKKTPSSGYINDTNGNYPSFPNSSSPNPEYGRLTLESVKTYGRGSIPGANESQLYDYMPPYVFDYHYREAVHEENTLEELPVNTQSQFYNQVFQNLYPNSPYVPKQYKYVRANKDNWGFREGNPKDKYGNEILGENNESVNSVVAWSLKSITTPQGSEIEVDYEEDDFYVEAFSRRYWENNLRIKATNSESHIKLEIENQNGFSSPVNFQDYFYKDERVFIDLWICRKRRGYDWSDTGKLNVRPEDNCIVSNVSSNRLTVLVPKVNGVTLTGDDRNRVLNRYFDKLGEGSHVYEEKARGICANTPRGGINNPADRHSMKYKLLSNRVAPGKSGGGLRVKDIVVKDGLGSEYITRYNYNDPFKNRTSGITSFNPVRGEVFVPYQNELPGPGVMYEWVTMQAIEKIGNQEKVVGKTRYHYYTLNPYFAIFNPNIEMSDIDGDVIFKASVEEVPMNYSNATAKDIKIEKNLTKIGQLISIEEFNGLDQLMSKSINSYTQRQGELSETFSSMKTTIDFNEDNDGDESGHQIKNHYLALSTKSEKVSVLKKVENITQIGKSVVEYSNPDPWLGTYTSSKRTLKDGSIVYEHKIPAYGKYPEMGPKALHPNNKNMLTQEAMTVTSIGGQTLNASITTWNDTWDYTNIDGSKTTQSGIWRKHKSYVWKDDVNPNSGTYKTSVTANNDHFNWNTNQPTGVGLEKWQNVSEITAYTHWSSPVETKDINGNFASSKMSDNYSKVIASGNASLSEMYYSGMEYTEGGNYLDPEIQGASHQSSDMAHTGTYSAKLGNSGAVKVMLNHGQMRSGKYKLSVWANIANYNHLKFKKGNKLETFNGETVFACDWVQLNHYFDIPDNTTAQQYGVINTNYVSTNNWVYVDDFRIHPVYSSMNSYVYDHKTDELNYILDGNNMAKKFVYDKAGRLYKTYQEIENPNSKENDLVNGGFKLLNKYRYNYKNGSDAVANWPEQEDCRCCNDNGRDLPPNGSNPGTTVTEPCPLDYKTMLSAKLLQVGESEVMQTFRVKHPCLEEVQSLQAMGLQPIKWRWLTDYKSNTFSDFIDGGVEQQVPFTIMPCESKNGLYDKVWVVEVLVPNADGKPISIKEKIVDAGCKLIVSTDKWADVEISANYSSCGEDNKYSIRPYVIKPLHNNYSYYYRTYNHVTNQWSSYMPVTGSKNTFCGEVFYINNNYCKSGYSIYQTIQYRVLDNEKGDFYQSNPLDIYLDCASASDASKIITTTSEHYKYAQQGNVVEKDASGRIINTYNINKR
ncbi:hypothetical protein [Winogradskyella luteola]|uniref:Uncharacterized protein n=1 Tax=Winogradskyella luteola TaxID=2828330 RepID=A0A9X1FAM2_9FLAO|nr:hypothetical protein [Winogradskyella luteola]MBV7269075.1 hypothetical protein [Winogradskyella luteola]